MNPNRMNRLPVCGPVFVLLAVAGLHAPLAADDGDARNDRAGPVIRSLELHPETIFLRGPFSLQRFVVLGKCDDGTLVDVTARATVRSGAPAVFSLTTIDDETRPAVVPVGDGEGRLRIALGDVTLDATVTARDFGSPRPPSLVHDVISRFTRTGCNSGACHGAQHGRGGFKLSLLGYVPDDDAAVISHEARGRRLARFDPARSLLIRKPLGDLAHEGGQVFRPGSRLHDALLRWVAAGAPGPSDDERRIDSLVVFPGERVLRVGEETLLLATAQLSDGSTEDVTGKVLLSSLNDGVATVDDEGRVVARSCGETAIMVRYQGQAQIARITVPFREIDTPAEFAANNFIDEIVGRKWRRLGLVPSGLASDGEFMRRVYLRAIGTLPSPDEVRKFLGDTASDKRERLIDAVLERPEYVDYWTLKWGDVLRVDRNTMNEKGMWAMYNWLRGEVRANRPLDEMVSTLITAEGSTYTSGPTNYYRVATKPNDLAETTSQVFLGVRLQCAQCHHHPFEKWTQQDYYGMAAYFSRLGLKASSEFGVYGQERVVHVKKSGEVRHPRTGKVVPPTPLDADPADDPADRRRALARWLTSGENRLFARNIANRFWGYVMGRGIVEPMDDMRVTNPPSIPELVDALADEFVRSGFDQKHLVGTIMRSRVFQLSARELPGNRDDEVFYSHFLVRRLPAEVLLDAIVRVTGVEQPFSGLPAGTRAIQLPDTGFGSYFLDSFGKPKRAIACECERAGKPNMAQALHLLNGDFIQKRVSDPKGAVGEVLAKKIADTVAIEEFYLATFARRPTAEESENLEHFIRDAPTRKEGLEDVLWALCNSSEFLFNH